MLTGLALILLGIETFLSNFRLNLLDDKIEDLRNQLKDLHSKLDME